MQRVVILLGPIDMVENTRCGNSFSKYNKKNYFPSNLPSFFILLFMATAMLIDKTWEAGKWLPDKWWCLKKKTFNS